MLAYAVVSCTLYQTAELNATPENRDLCSVLRVSWRVNALIAFAVFLMMDLAFGTSTVGTRLEAYTLVRPPSFLSSCVLLTARRTELLRPSSCSLLGRHVA